MSVSNINKYSELMAVAIRTVNRLISSNLSIGMGSVVDKLDISGYACQALAGDMIVLVVVSNQTGN